MGARSYQVRRAIAAPPAAAWADGMPLGLFVGRRTFTLADDGQGGTDFSMVEAFTGPLSGLVTTAIPDLTESFDQLADGLKAAAEAHG